MNATHEEWRPVVGYEGSYEVSDQGRVRSLERTIEAHGEIRSGHTRLLKGRVLRHGIGRGGYHRVALVRQCHVAVRFVHRLVLEAFVGPAPEGMECCHNNGDKADNRLVNLRWGTRSENMYDKIRHGVHHEANKTHCPYGHEYDYFYVNKKGHNKRGCKTCRYESNRRIAAQKQRRRNAQS